MKTCRNGVRRVINLPKQTPDLSGTYMARFLVNNRHQNDMCHNKIGICAPFVLKIWTLSLTKIMRSIEPLKEKGNLHFSSQYLLHHI